MITVKTNGWIIGRNGTFSLAKIQLHTHPEKVTIGGVDERGFIINGGLTIDTKAMDKLAAEWLTFRGVKLLPGQ